MKSEGRSTDRTQVIVKKPCLALLERVEPTFTQGQACISAPPALSDQRTGKFRLALAR
jgi:hypothetical protein